MKLLRVIIVGIMLFASSVQAADLQLDKTLFQQCVADKRPIFACVAVMSGMIHSMSTLREKCYAACNLIQRLDKPTCIQTCNHYYPDKKR